MKIWSIYDAATGKFTGAIVGGRDEDLASNIPEGCAAIEEAHDHLSRCVDLATGRVVDWQPPKPDDNHEWNATTRRWHKRPEVAAREERERQARTLIDKLERAQHRPVRELMIDPQNAQVRAQLTQIEREIAIARAALSETP